MMLYFTSESVDEPAPVLPYVLEFSEVQRTFAGLKMAIRARCHGFLANMVFGKHGFWQTWFLVNMVG